MSNIIFNVFCSTEPILQWVWKLGVPVKIDDTLPHLINTTVTKSPCATDAAIIGLIYDAKITGTVNEVLGFIY